MSRDGSSASRIDWAELLQRQEKASEALRQKPVRDPERELSLLKARAASLALRPERPGEGQQLDCLEFQLSGESYAVEMRYVSETLPLAEFTQVFCAPPFVLGIINVRGRIVSIIDLRRFFELPAIGLSDLNRVIVIGNGSMQFGILADAISGITPVSTLDLQAAPATFTGIRQEFLAGVTAGRLALLDAGRILSDPRIVVHEEVG